MQHISIKTFSDFITLGDQNKVWDILNDLRKGQGSILNDEISYDEMKLIIQHFEKVTIGIITDIFLKACEELDELEEKKGKLRNKLHKKGYDFPTLQTIPSIEEITSVVHNSKKLIEIEELFEELSSIEDQENGIREKFQIFQ